MPHKRAKRSVREQQKSARYADQDPAPTSRNIQDEAIPKSISRILNAAQIRADYSLKKRKREKDEDAGETKANGSSSSLKKRKKDSLAILPGESLSQFNRRVEDDMRPLLKSTLQSSSRKTKVAAPKQQKTEQDPPPQVRSDFEKKSSSAPCRLNDIVTAPPQLDKVFRGSARVQKNTEDGRGSGVVSMAQKLMMESERENAIQRYRELKERRLKEQLSVAE